MKKYSLFVVFLLGIISLLLPTGNTPSPIYAQNNTITIGTTDLPRSLDPAQASDFMSWEVLSHLFTGLTRQIPGTTEYELAVAASHTVSEDGLTHTFVIRDDAQFTDGTAITAETFVYSINRVLTLDYAAANHLEDIGLQASVNEDGALVLTINRPVPYFEALVALPMFFPVLASEFPATEANPFIETLTGNGVYMLAGWDVGDFINLQANPDFAYGDVAKTENIVLRSYDNTEALRQALIAREIDVAWRDVLLSDAELTAEETEGVVMINTPSSRMWYLMLNRTFDYVDDPVIRRSVMMTLDRDRIVEQDFGGYLTAAYSLVPPQLANVHNPLWQTEPDVETAGQNLRDAGYRESRLNQASFAISSSQPGYGNLHVAALASIVRDTRPLRVLTVTTNAGGDLGTFTDALVDGDTSAALFPWTPLVMHPDAYLRPLLHSAGPLAVNNRYQSPEIDAALDDAALASTSEQQNALYQEAQTLIYDSYALIPLWQDTLTIVAWEDVGGIVVEPNFFMRYDQLILE